MKRASKKTCNFKLKSVDKPMISKNTTGINMIKPAIHLTLPWQVSLKVFAVITNCISL